MRFDFTELVNQLIAVEWDEPLFDDSDVIVITTKPFLSLMLSSCASRFVIDTSETLPPLMLIAGFTNLSSGPFRLDCQTMTVDTWNRALTRTQLKRGGSSLTFLSSNILNPFFTRQRSLSASQSIYRWFHVQLDWNSCIDNSVPSKTLWSQKLITDPHYIVQYGWKSIVSLKGYRWKRTDVNSLDIPYWCPTWLDVRQVGNISQRNSGPTSRQSSNRRKKKTKTKTK